MDHIDTRLARWMAALLRAETNEHREQIRLQIFHMLDEYFEHPMDEDEDEEEDIEYLSGL